MADTFIFNEEMCLTREVHKNGNAVPALNTCLLVLVTHSLQRYMRTRLRVNNNLSIQKI